MSTLTPKANKGEVEESYKHMIPCGEYEMRAGNTETHGGDGINGTIVVPQSKVKAAGAGPKQKVHVKVEADGSSISMEREIHNSGNTLTIPLEKRRELDLQPGDTIEFWIEGVHAEETTREEEVQKTLSEEEKTPTHKEADDFVVIGDSFTYHLIEDDDADETVCGVSFDDENIRTGSDPGDFLDVCHECKARSSRSLTAKEVIDLLEDKVVGFELSEGPPTELTMPQLNAIKDVVIDREDTEADLREYRARVARLEQRIQELEQEMQNIEDEKESKVA